MKAISYIRVSTKHQDKSGLSQIHQEQAIIDFCKREGFEIIASFEDVDSGGKDDRTGLNEALQRAKEEGATIVCAKLCRLSRSVYFVSGLMAHGVPFLITELGRDVPNFLLHVYVSAMELERTLCGERTAKALAIARDVRGVKLGSANPNIRRAHIKRGNKSFEAILPHIQDAQEQGFTSTRKIATFLNDKGITTPRGKSWTSKQISRILIKKQHREGKQLELFPSQGQ